VGIVLYELGIFSFARAITTYTGFARLKPQLAQTELQGGGSLQLVLVNALGSSITVDSATVRVNGGIPRSATPPSDSIRSGDPFLLVFSGAEAGIMDGDSATVEVTVVYNTLHGGVSLSRQETGTLRMTAMGTLSCTPACGEGQTCVLGTCQEKGTCGEGQYECPPEFPETCCEATQTCGYQDSSAICCDTATEIPCVAQDSSYCCGPTETCGGSGGYHSVCCVTETHTPCVGDYGAICCGKTQECGVGDYSVRCCPSGTTPCLPNYYGHDGTCCNPGESCSIGGYCYFCGDGNCNSGDDEDCETCPEDCGECSSSTTSWGGSSTSSGSSTSGWSSTSCCASTTCCASTSLGWYSSTTSVSASSTSVSGSSTSVGAVCGNAILEGDEVCDSDFTDECPSFPGYYMGSYVDDGGFCSSAGACNSDCSSCASHVACSL
jgi:hypothetical protein